MGALATYNRACGDAPPLPTAVHVQKREEWEAREGERRAARERLNASTDASVVGGEGGGGAPRFISFVPLPEQQEIELRVMARKKEELLAKYASDGLIQQQEAAKQLLNVRDT